jgi:hypothetical protein
MRGRSSDFRMELKDVARAIADQISAKAAEETKRQSAKISFSRTRN